MPPILVDMPWPPDAGETLRWPGGAPVTDPATGRPFQVLHDQLIIWVSLAPVGLPALPPGFPMFPAVLDPGFNDAFLMPWRQAIGWMGPGITGQLPPSGYDLKIGPARLPGCQAVVWAHPNVPGTRAPDPAGTSVPLFLPNGAVLIPPGSPHVKEKPLLGLLAIRFNRLVLHIDGGRERVSLDAL